MKIIRSSKCSLKFATNKKQEELQTVLKEYGKVVNCFIDIFWDNPVEKRELLKPVVDIPQTWFSARLRKVAAREAIDMVSSVKEVFNWNKQQIQSRIDVLENKIKNTKPDTKENRRNINYWYKKMKIKNMKLNMVQIHKPKHNGKHMNFSSNIANLQTSKTNRFDSWLHLASIGNKIILDLPIKQHKHFNRLNKEGKRLNSYIINKDSVQFCFEIETGSKKEVNRIIGVDTGINALASTSDNRQYGKDIKGCIERSKRCKPGSKGKQKAIRALKQRIDEVAKEVVQEVDLVVVEKLKGLNESSKLKGRLSQNMRSSIGSWNYSYWLMRVQQNCERNRVSFRTVASYNTSRTCPTCGHVDRMNRVGEIFRCQACDYTDNADLVAARNIKNRFVTGKYGSCYKLLNDSILQV